MAHKITLTDLQKEKVEEHTRQCYPQEMCGFLTEDDFIPVANVSENPEKSFKIDAIDSVKYLSKSIAIVHSHTASIKAPTAFNLCTPSYADYLGQLATGKPWLIVGCDEYSISAPLQFPRIPNNKYLGREFQWFVSDCYNLVQDYYFFELGITLKDAVIKESYSSIRTHNNIFDEFIEDYGFIEVDIKTLQDNDLLLMNTAGFRGNHLGIYTKGKVYHQDLVSACVYYEEVGERVTKVLRYVG